MEMSAEARLHMIMGTRNGLTRVGPFSSSTWCCSQIVSRPPTPVPTIVPARSGSPRSGSMPPASLTAWSAARAASWTKRSARRTSLARTGCSHRAGRLGGRGLRAARRANRAKMPLARSHRRRPRPGRLRQPACPAPRQCRREHLLQPASELRRHQLVSLADRLHAFEL